MFEIVAALPDLARLVHGNFRSIQKLVREFCEFWRSRNLPDATSGESATDENAPVVKVSKRKTEAKIREIAVYEFRPQCYKQKLWYVNDKTLEKLNLSLPVPTEWKWITLVKSTEVDTASVTKQQSVSVTSIQPSPASTSGTIKSFMSSMTPNESCQPSPARLNVNTDPSPGQLQSMPVSSSTAESINTTSPLCTSAVCDNVTTGLKLDTHKPVQPFSTPRSSCAVKKRKVQPVGRRSLPMKKQPCLLFAKKLQQPANDDDCMVVDSSVVIVDNAISSADKPCVQPSDLGLDSEVKTAQQPAGDDDCMIVDSCVLDSESRTVSDATEHPADLQGEDVGTASDVQMICDEKTQPETDANCNVCVETSASDANKPVESILIVDD